MKRKIAVAVASLGLALVGHGSAAAEPFKPILGRYTATVPGTTAQNVMTLEVLRRNRTYRTRVLKVVDDCAAGLFRTPLGLGRLFAKDFKYQGSGFSSSLSFTINIDGLFTNATTAKAQVKTKETQSLPPPGTPPGICADDTTFTLKFQGPPKPRK